MPGDKPVNPTCFISYSWDSESHKTWVRSLATRLQVAGVVTYLDQWDVRPGTDLTRYMETSIRESDFVLLICTPLFGEKANSGHGGVGYEKMIVTGEVFGHLGPESKFVPLLRAGDQRTALPSYLRSRVFIDFRRDDDFEKNLQELLRHLHSAPELERPYLGAKPGFMSPSEASTPFRATTKKFELATFDLLFRYAYEGTGLNLSKDQAVAWAEAKMEHVPPFDLKSFQKLFEYAYGGSGLNLTREQAIKWAEDRERIGR